jgi:hypothetical protein
MQQKYLLNVWPSMRRSLVLFHFFQVFLRTVIYSFICKLTAAIHEEVIQIKHFKIFCLHLQVISLQISSFLSELQLKF